MADFTPEEAEAVRQAARILLAREDFLTYYRLMNPAFDTPPHVRLICEKLQQVERGSIRRLLILAPPRAGKSELASGCFPSWVLGRHPDWRVILATHTASLAETFSGQNRDRIKTHPLHPLIFPRAVVSATSRSSEKWALEGQRESMLAVGATGALVGWGANILVMDDIVRNLEEASSEAYQEKLFDWYKTAARTRLTPDGRIVIIMTHWTRNDIAAKLLASEEAGEFEVLHLPAFSLGVYEDYPGLRPGERPFPYDKPEWWWVGFPDPLGRRRGEPLWPQRFDREFLERTQRLLGSQFTALYQGTPLDEELASFQRGKIRRVTYEQLSQMGAVRIVDVPPVRSWDLAFSGTAGSDYTVGLRCSLWSSREVPVLILVEDMVRFRLDWSEAYQEIVRVTNFDPPHVVTLMEAVAAQSLAVKSLRRDPLVQGRAILSTSPNQDKATRALTGMRYVSMGMVFILGAPDWERDFLDELASFGRGAHDDIVDAFSQVCNHWSSYVDMRLNQAIRGELEKVSPNPPVRRARLPFALVDEGPAGYVTVDKLAWNS